MTVNPPKMEERLYQNRYLVDEGRPHISINRKDQDSLQLQALMSILFR